MSRLLLRDVDTTLEFDSALGAIDLFDESDKERAAIILTPDQAVNLASGLLQYATSARTKELSLAREKADKESA